MEAMKMTKTLRAKHTAEAHQAAAAKALGFNSGESNYRIRRRSQKNVSAKHAYSFYA
jgi:hypothetical protein